VTNVQKITTSSNVPARPKLALRKPVPSADSFYFNWVAGRRGPRHRYAVSAEAFMEAKRLRAMGLEVHTYTATEITE